MVAMLSSESALDPFAGLVAQLLPKWIARGQIPARGMDVGELGPMIAEVLATAVSYPGVDCQQVTLRAPGVLFSGDVDQVAQSVRPNVR